MGHASSKAKEVANRTTASAAAVSRVSQAIQAQRTIGEAEIHSKRSGDSSSGEYSPTRGHNQQHNNTTITTGEKIPEMPPELIKFLNDAGPLKRTVDKELTSSKVYDALVADEKTREEHTRQANLRVRRKMPLVSYNDHDKLIRNDERRNNKYMDAAPAVDEECDGDDGTMTTRTTNFSTRDISASTKSDFGLDRMEIFQLALKLKEIKVNSSKWKEELENEFKQIRRKKMLSSKGDTKDFGQLKDFALFENSMRYIGVPVLMKDTEDDIVGVPSHKVEDLRFSGLKEVPDEKVIFVMKAEGQKEAKSTT